MDGKGKPRLQPQVQEAQLGIEVVKVLMQAFHPLATQIQFLRLAIRAHTVGDTGFDAGQYADQALRHAVGAGDAKGNYLGGETPSFVKTHIRTRFGLGNRKCRNRMATGNFWQISALL